MPTASKSMSTEDPAPNLDEMATWTSKMMAEDPELLRLRERLFPWMDAHSFDILRKSLPTSSAALDRHKVLELIYQHLNALDLRCVADTLAAETKLEFAGKLMPHERTDLRLLVSMALGPRDNLWDYSEQGSIEYNDERFDFDNIVADYREECSYPAQAMPYSELETCTLCELVYSLVKYEDNDFTPFVLAFNSICKTSHLMEHIRAVKAEVGVPPLLKTILAVLGPWLSPAIRSQILQLVDEPAPKEAEPVAMPDPIIDDPKTLFSPLMTIIDPDPEEIARQLSRITHEHFARIHPFEFYHALSNRKYSYKTPHLLDLYTFGEKVKGLVAEILLSSKDKREYLSRMRRIIEIASKLLELRNYESLSWIVSAFSMKCISRLDTWAKQISDEDLMVFGRIMNGFNYKVGGKEYDLKLMNADSPTFPMLPDLRHELLFNEDQGLTADDFISDHINWGKRVACSKYLSRYHAIQTHPFAFHRILQIETLLETGPKITKEQLNSMSIQLLPFSHE